jgi:hypothetical protein
MSQFPYPIPTVPAFNAPRMAFFSLSQRFSFSPSAYLVFSPIRVGAKQQSLVIQTWSQSQESLQFIDFVGAAHFHWTTLHLALIRRTADVFSLSSFFVCVCFFPQLLFFPPDVTHIFPQLRFSALFLRSADSGAIYCGNIWIMIRFCEGTRRVFPLFPDCLCTAQSRQQ